MSLTVLHAFRTMVPGEADRWFFENPHARAQIELQILKFPSVALPSPEEAVCIGGVVPVGGIAEMWMLIGAGFRRKAPVVLGQLRGLCVTAYEALDLHRLEMRCVQGREGARLWAERLGFEFETTLKRAGARGENVDVYLWPDERGSDD